MPTIKRIRIALIGLLLVVTSGTILFHAMEGDELIDSIYFTVVTLTTVGYGDVTPETPQGKALALVIILAGVGLFGLLLGSLTELLVEGQIRRAMGRRKVEKDLLAIHDHFIVCGYGRIGSIVCREFHSNGVPFVVIENGEDALAQAGVEGYLCLDGDATDDDILLKAGLERAKGVVAVLPSDADNVFITMTARDVSRRLQIVTRGEDHRTTRKLLRAGATRVISPHEIGGIRMANAVLRPHVIDFVEAATRAGTEIHMEEVQVNEGNRFAGKTIVDSNIRGEFGVIIVAIRKLNGRMLFNPSAKAEIETGDVLITMGPEAHQERLLDACG